MPAWSDGEPVTSKDVAYTFNGQLTNDKLPYHASFDQFVKDGPRPMTRRLIVNFKIPAPRFKYEVLTFKFDTGIPIVPEHAAERAGRRERLRRAAWTCRTPAPTTSWPGTRTRRS